MNLISKTIFLHIPLKINLLHSLFQIFNIRISENCMHDDPRQALDIAFSGQFR